MGILQKRLDSKDEARLALKEPVKHFILELTRDKFLDVFILSLIASSTQEPPSLKEIYPLIGEPFIDSLIVIGTERVTRITDLFKKYVFQTKIVKMMTALGEAAINRLKIKAADASAREEVNLSLIELMGYMKNEELVESIAGFLSLKDPFARRTALLALSEIMTDKSRQVISAVVANDKDKSIRLFAREQLTKMKKG